MVVNRESLSFRLAYAIFFIMNETGRRLSRGSERSLRRIVCAIEREAAQTLNQQLVHGGSIDIRDALRAQRKLQDARELRKSFNLPPRGRTPSSR